MTFGELRMLRRGKLRMPIRRIRTHVLPGIDWILVGLTAALCGAGALCIYAATAAGLTAGGASPYRYLERDLVNLAIGSLLCAGATVCNYRLLAALAPVLYAGTCVLLLAVLTPLGSRVNGAHAWFSLGSQQFEPSELTKIVVILMVAGLLCQPPDGEVRPRTRDLVLCLALVMLPLLLILAEPALGVAIIVAVLAFVLLGLAGAGTRFLVVLLVAVALGSGVIVQLHLLKPYQEQRFTALAHPDQDTSGSGYHTVQSLTAIGDGGLFGQGFLQGSQTNGYFVPEQQTDFVFTVAAEEGGFVGAGALLLALTAICLRGLRIAEKAPDMFGKLVAGGVAVWFAVQTFVNVGMTMGIMPVTGLPLPFVSYGGTAAFVDLIGVGLLLNVARQSRCGAPVPMQTGQTGTGHG
ncbi:rod shape-determining protein RodA [Frankia sp. Cas4]|uniref:rod shape-determining protein RodA n=1 Tax=Frankia sp. Cas4 TaxID=3073927 RepID=UPI002AD2B958|nr:rod shape-determining protein RodA [Frankia sp. Cas4]